MFGSLQHLAEEAFGCPRVSFCAEHEVNRLAGGIDGAVEVIPLPFDFDVGLIDAVGVIGRSEVRAASFLQFRRIRLYPAVDRRVIDLQAALIHHFFEISIAQTVTQIPADAEENDLGLVVSPLERVGFNHGRPPDENKKRVSLPSSKTSRLFLQHNRNVN
jgi:hypothetical protein